jgi:hypothetical protein
MSRPKTNTIANSSSLDSVSDSKSNVLMHKLKSSKLDRPSADLRPSKTDCSPVEMAVERLDRWKGVSNRESLSLFPRESVGDLLKARETLFASEISVRAIAPRQRIFCNLQFVS